MFMKTLISKKNRAPYISGPLFMHVFLGTSGCEIWVKLRIWGPLFGVPEMSM